MKKRGRPKKIKTRNVPEADIDYKNIIVYRGSNPLREDESFQAHGLIFAKDVAYEVSDEVLEFLKGQKYFYILKGMSNHKVDF